MKKEYLTFVQRLDDLVERKEIELTIRDLTPGQRKYDAKVVKAVLSGSPEGLPDGDILWVRSWIGILYPDPWGIKILGEVGEYLSGKPHGETLGVD
jgi:hypothetical protein